MKKYTIITAAAIAALCSSGAYAEVSCNVSNTSANVEVRNNLLYAPGTARFVGRNGVRINNTSDTSSGRYVATLCSLAKNAIPNASTAQKNSTSCALTLKVNNTVRTGNCSDLSRFNPVSSGGGASSGGGSGSSGSDSGSGSTCSISATIHPTNQVNNLNLTYISSARITKGSVTTTEDGGRWLETICRTHGSNCSVRLNKQRPPLPGGIGGSHISGTCGNTNHFLPRNSVAVTIPTVCEEDRPVIERIRVHNCVVPGGGTGWGTQQVDLRKTITTRRVSGPGSCPAPVVSTYSLYERCNVAPPSCTGFGTPTRVSVISQSPCVNGSYQLTYRTVSVGNSPSGCVGNRDGTEVVTQTCSSPPLCSTTDPVIERIAPPRTACIRIGTTTRGTQDWNVRSTTNYRLISGTGSCPAPIVSNYIERNVSCTLPPLPAPPAPTPTPTRTMQYEYREVAGGSHCNSAGGGQYSCTARYQSYRHLNGRVYSMGLVTSQWTQPGTAGLPNLATICARQSPSSNGVRNLVRISFSARGSASFSCNRRDF